MKSENKLKELGVCILDKYPLRLQCIECKQIWSPKLLEHGRLLKGYWKCPKGCNNKPILDEKQTKMRRVRNIEKQDDWE